MYQKFIEIESNHRALKYHICCDHIGRFEHDEEKVTLIPPEYYSCDGMPQFLYQTLEVVAMESHNNHYDKMVLLKSKTKSWQCASFGMCNEHYAI